MDISNAILSSGYGLPHPLNAQNIFDKAALHLVHQGKRSLSNTLHGGCAYRGDGGVACAVGALISDENYSPDMENKTARHLAFEDMPELRPYVDLLEAIQNLHDIDARAGKRHDPALDMDKLVNGLREIALNNELSDAVLIAPQVAEVIAPSLPAEITSLLRPSPVKTEA